MRKFCHINLGIRPLKDIELVDTAHLAEGPKGAMKATVYVSGERYDA
jgi:hypothetical protein